MKFKNKLFILLVIIILTLAACDNSDDSADNNEEKQEVTTITMSASGNGAFLLPNLEADFEADNPNYDLNILTDVASFGGVRGINEGLLDIAIMTRSLNDAESEAMPSFVFIPLGKVGVSILAHPTVTIDSLTIIQLLSMFGGGITNWSEVGGPDEAIVLFYRDAQEGIQQGADSLEFALPDGFAFPETAIVITNATDMISSIENTEYSIGYDTWVGPEINRPEIKTIQVDGIGPTEANYLITIPFGIGYLGDNADTVQVFVDWLSSEAGQNALRDLGVILE